MIQNNTSETSERMLKITLPQRMTPFFSAGFFFCAYEGVKVLGDEYLQQVWDPVLHMTAASVGETVSIQRRETLF